MKYLYELEPGTIIELVNGENPSCKLVITDKLKCYQEYRPEITWRVLVDINTGDTVEWAISALELPDHWQVYKPKGNRI